ncbi:heparan-alpha-glucosaminide N-acetyltransferase domain-containing protein, partial [Streptomyces sp. CT34]|uniref:heparan-alpha-glucosaminide N-acetyltransferase domain-containing protein n=1 Tax=Streptomyces sp. CT34 TaxID=1553907 RepID=UPI001F51F090
MAPARHLQDSPGRRVPPSDDAPASTHETGRTSAGRLIGVDLARGLAVFGMYAAHVGPDPDEGGVTGFLMELTHGRASALFALLAGFAVVLITGRSTPKTGRAGRQAVAKVVIRAAVLVATGAALTMAGTPVDVILAFYGVYFLLVLPLYRLSARSLAVIAAGTAVVFPQLLYAAMQVIGDGTYDGAHHGRSAVHGIISLLFSGSYPAITWVPFVIA